MEFKIKQDLLQAIHDYLVTRPMQEVEGLVSGVRACEKIDGPEKVKDDQ